MVGVLYIYCVKHPWRSNMADLKVVKIGLVDDHRIFRDGAKKLIENYHHNNISVVYEVSLEAENGQEMIEKMNLSELPEVLFLDINMPIMDGYDSIDWLKMNHPAIKVIVLTMFSDAESIIKMLKKGANAFLTKNASTEDFMNAIESVRNGGMYFTKDVNKELANVLNKQIPKEPSELPLSKKEKEFLKLLSSELSYKEIAEKIGVSPRTVDGYRENLLSKLGYKSRIGLVVYAMENGIVK